MENEDRWDRICLECFIRRLGVGGIRMKKICWISDFPLRGSSFGTVSYELLTRMPKDYSFDVLSLGYEGMPLKLSENIRIFELKKTHQLKYYYEKLKPEITVVFHSFWLLNSMANELPLMSGKKILYLPCEGNEIPIQYSKYFTFFDNLATPSNFSKKVIKNAGYNAVVIPHGVDTSFFTIPKKEWREFRFGYLGLNDIRKQIPRLMEAYARLKQGMLVIASENEGHYDLINLAKQYSISPAFIESKLHGLTMNREAVRDFLQSLDVYISPGSESFGLPALEAQACGIPVIANSHGAAKEVLGNGAVYCRVSDYLETSVGKVGLMSTSDLYKKMRFLLQVKEVWEKTSKKAIANAQKWPWSNSVKILGSVLEN